MALFSSGLSTHIFNNNLKSALLLAGFPILIFAMAYAFSLGLYYFNDSGSGYTTGGMSPLPPDLYGRALTSVISFAPHLLIGILIWFSIAWFSHTRMIRAATGAVPVTRAQYPKIYNMLENLCISRGIPMPTFQIIDSPALNAFASGINQKTYAITLTRGIVDALEDDELEAVIAHELAHIMNRDVRLLIISVIFVGIISFLAEMAFRSMIYGRGTAAARYGRSDRQGGGGMVVLLAFAVLAVGYIFALIIRFALSRKREYLADAGAVELTKNPEGMMRALKRISGQAEVKDMPPDIKQMCIENKAGFMGVFSTHPPIEKRIQAIAEMTNTAVPDLPLTLKRPPRRPWDNV